MKINSVSINCWIHPTYGGKEITNDYEAEILFNEVKDFIKSKGYNIKNSSNEDDCKLSVFKR